MTRRNSRRDAGLVLLAAVFLRTCFVLETADDPLFHALAIDARSYHQLALQVASGDVLLGTDPLWFAPGYPWFLGAIYRVFGAHPSVATFLQMALGVASAGIAWKMGARVSRGAGLVAGLLVALWPVLLIYENQLLYTSLAVFLTAAFLFAFTTATSVARAAVAGAALGLLSLVASSAVLFAPLGAWRLLRRHGRGAALLFLAGTGLLLTPVLLRNGIVSGVWSPFPMNGGMLFGTGFSKDAVGGRAQLRTPTDCGPNGSYQREAEAAVGHELSLAEVSRWHRDGALARIAGDPAWAVSLVARKVALLLNATEIDDNLGFGTYAERARALRWLPAAWAWLLLPGILGAALSIGRKDDRARDVQDTAWFALLFAASLLPFFVTARYRAPLVVPLAVLAGYAAASAGMLQSAPLPRILSLGALVLAVAFAAFRDPGVRENRVLALNAVGAALLNEGRAAEAEAAFDRAIAADPALAAAHANRALALLALQRNEEALAAAREATRLDANLVDAWMTQGAILARAGAFPEALGPYQHARELSPENPTVLSMVARCLAETGDFDGAATVGAQAVARGARDLMPLVEEWRARNAAGPETNDPETAGPNADRPETGTPRP